jgi:hypothetical protein
MIFPRVGESSLPSQPSWGSIASVLTRASPRLGVAVAAVVSQLGERDATQVWEQAAPDVSRVAAPGRGPQRHPRRQPPSEPLPRNQLRQADIARERPVCERADVSFMYGLPAASSHFDSAQNGGYCAPPDGPVVTIRNGAHGPGHPSRVALSRLGTSWRAPPRQAEHGGAGQGSQACHMTLATASHAVGVSIPATPRASPHSSVPGTLVSKCS